MKTVEDLTTTAELLNAQTPVQITMNRVRVPGLGEWIITGAMLKAMDGVGEGLIGLPFTKKAVEEKLLAVKRAVHPGLF